MKQIEVNSEVHGTHFIMVDDEDYESLSKMKWTITKGKYTFYAKRNIMPNRKYVTIIMHRYIMGVNDRKIIVDHIDRNGLNNQKSNLRLCSAKENNMNRIGQVNKTSNYKGVYLAKNGSSWSAAIRVENKRIHIGTYKKEDEAALAYNDFAIKNFKSFAYLNKVDKVKVNPIKRNKPLLDTNTGIFYDSITEAARAYNCCVTKISDMMSGNTINRTGLIRI